MKKQDKDYLQLVGKNIRKKREKKEISQQELADLANIAKTTLQKIELARMNPSVLILRNICAALEMDLSDLVKK